MAGPLIIFWFRRDLRLDDQRGLFHALSSGLPVLPVFIFDPAILDPLPVDDRRVSFIHKALQAINEKLRQFGSRLVTLKASPAEAFEYLLKTYDLKAVFTNHDYEPYAIARDQALSNMLSNRGVSLKTFKDQVIFEKSDITKSDGSPYTVFTPYANSWRKKLRESDLEPLNPDLSNFAKVEWEPVMDLREVGFHRADSPDPEIDIQPDLLQQYALERNYPGLDTTSRIGIHLRFGTVSVRKAVSVALNSSHVWLNELIWREFFMTILYHFPKVEHAAFKPAYDLIQWRNNEDEFELWCRGETGYELVDAGMRQLRETGWMHNRVRMVTASFLCKHLLIDWRWGEAWFAQNLLDYELSSNNGNWQWAAGSGCDSAPYFRIFNPILQAKKFDPGNTYINTWLPDSYKLRYIPIVEHRFARERALRTYKNAL